MFKPVDSQVDFVALEKELLKYWYEQGIVEKYLDKNKDSEQKFSFLDGPITANNPMGVHHAWGRTYKDLWQRFYNMKGYKQRFQNGFDEQGLWVEVNVEKDLGLKSKKDILNLIPGDEFASLEKFVNLCKERVAKYSAVQTEQSKRLGYFMDWDNSYHTSSEENNYAIWNFLKVVNEKGWLYKGHDSVPWCPRCGTAISQHEILTEDYKELEHESVFLKLPIKNKENEFLLIWTTTPWTIPANVAVAVNVEETYIGVEVNEEKLWVMRGAVNHLLNQKILPFNTQKRQTLKGSALIGWEYEAPFDDLERVKKSLGDYIHRVVETDPLILPISEEEGTGLVHVATGAGTEDFKLGKKLALPVIEVIDEEATYLSELGEFSNQNAKEHPEIIIDYLKTLDGGKFLFKLEQVKHRYPVCWRCKSELVWRVVDEWYINMDGKDGSGKSYREQMIEVAKKINWLPKWALDRELDWLKNMHDWLISKKRFWGLSLPVWECKKCKSFEVMGSIDELKTKAVEGWDKFEGHTPHRPWIDQVKIKCSKCSEIISRIPDVGNPWLDAGIVPFSTLPEEFFPADFITEAFPGQFKNWFYSLIAMSTALKGTNPFKNILGHALVIDDKGEPMHKSSGNYIPFDEGVEKMGADVMRWAYSTAAPDKNLSLTYEMGAEIKRRFLFIFWNSYKFFIDKASVVDWVCELERGELKLLDKWILARLTEVVLLTNKSLEKFDASFASRAIEEFVVNDLSTWYIRRIRDRVSMEADTKDRNLVLGVIYGNLVTLTKLLAPFIPFISEEMYMNLAEDKSVHLTDYPLGDQSLLNDQLIKDMKLVRLIAEKAHKLRKDHEIKLRQPLSSLKYISSQKLDAELEQIVADELNVKLVEYEKSPEKDIEVELNTKLTPALIEEGEVREFIRSIQNLRKENNLTLKDKIKIFAPNWHNKFEELILKSTAADKITVSEALRIEKID